MCGVVDRIIGLMRGRCGNGRARDDDEEEGEGREEGGGEEVHCSGGLINRGLLIWRSVGRLWKAVKTGLAVEDKVWGRVDKDMFCYSRGLNTPGRW